MLAEQPKEDDVQPVVRGLRYAAMQEIRSRGVGYILVQDSDGGADDFLTRNRAWGITELDAQGGARLYRIDEPAEGPAESKDKK